MKPLVLGTRGSRLALVQAHAMADALGGEAEGITLKIVQTRGDRLREMRFSEQLDKGFFTTELETSLSVGEVDFVVHSLKDLPTENPAGLSVGAIPKRAPTGDVLLVRPDVLDHNPDSHGLPLRSGSTVGTSAARRRALLAHLDPRMVGVDLRGNVPTRVKKCVDGVVDAIVLARAGLERLGLDVAPLIPFDLVREVWIPAPGQGALAIQIRSDDDTVRARIAALNDDMAQRSVTLERQVLATLEGGCHAACGAVLLIEGSEAVLHFGMVKEPGEGWQYTTLRFPALGDMEQLPQECARIIQAVEDLNSPKAGTSESRPWWKPAIPWKIA